MLSWFKKRREAASPGEPKVIVFLNPLVVLLAGRKRQKGSPLTEEEVLEVRDGAQCIAMPASQAEKFYGSLDSQFPVPRLNPDNIWQEWQAIRSHLE